MSTPGSEANLAVEAYRTAEDLRSPERPAVLLSHGFTGSTVSMLPWAKALEAEGLTVSVPLLPGHGTRWQDLNQTTFDQWYSELARAFDELRATHREIFVFGLSMGGCLALKLAAERPSEVAGVAVVNPGLHSNRKDVKLLPVLKYLVPAFPGISNDIKAPGVREGAYTKTPLKAAHSLFDGMATVCKMLPSVKVPTQMYLSTVDHVLDPSSGNILRNTIGSRDFTEIALENSYHVATLDNDAAKIFSGSIDFINRVSKATSP